MLLNLKLLTTSQQQHHRVYLEERLPFFINTPCWVDCCYQVQKESRYTLLHMEISAELTVICQRCLSEFSVKHTNKTTLALCETESIANELMSDYECIVVSDGVVSLDDLIADDLHLYVPQKHEVVQDCDSVATTYLGEEAAWEPGSK